MRLKWVQLRPATRAKGSQGHSLLRSASSSLIKQNIFPRTECHQEAYSVTCCHDTPEQRRPLATHWVPRSLSASTQGFGTGCQLLSLFGPDLACPFGKRHTSHFPFWGLYQKWVSPGQDKRKACQEALFILKVTDYSSCSIEPLFPTQPSREDTERGSLWG